MSTPDLDESFAFQTLSPQSLRQAQSPHSDCHNHDYNFSASTYDESTDSALPTDEEDHLPLNDDHDLLQPTSTRVSSVSSFPASVIHHTSACETLRTPSKSPFIYDHEGATTPTYQAPREYSTGFRHPSSVRALQMRDEFELSGPEELNPYNRRDSRLSYFSNRSSGSAQSSPGKRLSRSNNSSPRKSGVKSKLQKEFPLVLLHCTLLPPALSLRAPHLSDNILEAIIPQPYGRRWKALQEKVNRNTEVKSRGVLISHPREEYELLEERLLESLELERPRLRNGHFLGTNGDRENNAMDSGFESASSSDNTEDKDETVQPDPCPDCGNSVSFNAEVERKWEIKIYAANGLLRSSGWSAAWQEMEKVDVEINVWMPADVRREVDSRLEALLEQEKLEKKVDKKLRRRERKQADDERMREIYGAEAPEQIDISQDRTQADIDGLLDEQIQTEDFATREQPVPDSAVRTQKRSIVEDDSASRRPANPTKAEVPLQELLVNYIRHLVRDTRNIAILLLSVLVLFYGMKQPKSDSASAITNLRDTTNESMDAAFSALSISEKPHSIVTEAFAEADAYTKLPIQAYSVVSSMANKVSLAVLPRDATSLIPDMPGIDMSWEDQRVCKPPESILTATQPGYCPAALILRSS